MPKAHEPNDAFEIRRGEIERIQNAGAHYTKISGKVRIIGVGESSYSVVFPVLFVEQPLFSCGPLLDPGISVVKMSLPTCTGTVHLWHERVRDDGTNIYAGAEIGFVSTGPTDQVMLVQWHMEGVALRGPVDEEDDE